MSSLKSWMRINVTFEYQISFNTIHSLNNFIWLIACIVTTIVKCYFSERYTLLSLTLGFNGFCL